MNKPLAFSAAFAGMLIFGICLLSLGSVLPFLSEELNLDELAKGSLATVLPLGMLAGSLIFGPVVDRYSYRWLMSVSAFIAASGILVMGYSKALIGLQFAFLMIGFGGGLLNGTTSALVSDLSEEGIQRKGASLSLLGVFFGIGALGVPALFGLIPESYGYRKVLLWIGFGLIIPALYFLFIRYPSAKQSSFSGFSTWRSLLQKRLLILIALVLFIQSGMESMINNWATTYLIEKTGLITQSALFSLTLFVLVFTITRLLLNFLLHKIPLRYIMGGAVGLSLLGGILLHFSTGMGGAYLAVVCFGMGFAAGFPVLMGMVGDAFPEWSGTAFSIVMTIAIIGNTLINYLVGWVTDISGMAALSVVLLISIFLYGVMLIPVFRNAKPSQS